jgi:hypothetical protein
MSGNNSFIKSMNGIVSFDSNGTTIEGDVITSGEIECTTLNATDVNATGALNTSYLFVDFIDKNIGTYITFISDVLFDYKIYCSEFFAATASTINFYANTTFHNSINVESINGNPDGSISKQLKIGFFNDNTTSVNIGRAEQIILGTVYPAIPARTTFYAVGNDDLANKLYVDNMASAGIVGLTNIFTGASNTFNNFIKTSKIDSVTPSAIYNFLTSHTGQINIGSTASDIVIGSTVSPVRTAYVPLISNDICNKSYVDSVAGGGGILTTNNVWTGTNQFGTITTNTGNFNNSSATTTCRLYSSTTDAVINIGQNQVTGGLLIGAAGTRTGDITIGAATCNTTIRSTLSVYNRINVQEPANNFELFENLTGNLNICNNQLSGVINIGQNKTSGWLLLSSPTVVTIIKGEMSCEQNITMSNPTYRKIYSPSSSIPFEIRGDNTLNVIGSSTTKFGSWNGGQVELATQSFSNIVIGAGGTGANARTTTLAHNTINIGQSTSTSTVNGVLVATNPAGVNCHLWGKLSYVTTNVNYTIVLADINNEFYLTITGGNPRIITMPARKLGQVLHFRSLSANNQLLTITGSSGSFKNPADNTNSPSYSLTTGRSVTYFDDGTNLIAFSN